MSYLPKLLPLAAAASVAACAVTSENADDGAAVAESNLAVHPKLEAEVKKNLERLEKEIGVSHLASYRGYGSIVGQFMWALDVEYGENRPLLERRAEVLASPIYFSMPEILPDADVGRRTPFHGMTETELSSLASSHDYLYGSHKTFNGGSKDGVRPFSVCETKYLIEIAKGKVTDSSFVSSGRVWSFAPYANAYAAWAKVDAGNCTQRDLAEFYNYRGLGELRPSWLESNYQDRVLRRMASMCKDPPPEWWGRCGEYGSGRLRFRDKKNRAMALRQMAYAPADEAYMTSPYNTVVLLEDRLGDGVAEWVKPGKLDLLARARFEIEHPTHGKKWVTVSNDKKTLTLDDGTALAITNEPQLAITSSGQFGGKMTTSFTFSDGTSATATLPPRVIKAAIDVDPQWKREWAGAPDMGLTRMYSDKATLLKRFTSMLDRHESFYQTYSSNDENDLNIVSQPSPLVACSVTLNAAKAWAHAGSPPGSRAGLIFLMRVPFADILTGDDRSIDTLGRLNAADPTHAGPKVLTLDRALSEGLDMGRVWLDLATLSNDLYASENEISKFGAVPAEEIEGILVLGKPGAVP